MNFKILKFMWKNKIYKELIKAAIDKNINSLQKLTIKELNLLSDLSIFNLKKEEIDPPVGNFLYEIQAIIIFKFY